MLPPAKHAAFFLSFLKPQHHVLGCLQARCELLDCSHCCLSGICHVCRQNPHTALDVNALLTQVQTQSKCTPEQFAFFWIWRSSSLTTVASNTSKLVGRHTTSPPILQLEHASAWALSRLEARRFRFFRATATSALRGVSRYLTFFCIS